MLREQEPRRKEGVGPRNDEERRALDAVKTVEGIVDVQAGTWTAFQGALSPHFAGMLAGRLERLAASARLIADVGAAEHETAAASPLMDVEEFAALFGMPIKSAYAYGRRHGLVVDISRARVRFDRAKTDAHLQALTNGGARR